jgi:hypothetical protein
MIQLRKSRVATSNSELFGLVIGCGYMKAGPDLAGVILDPHDYYILLMRITLKDAAF